jgi:hypothetical protein
MDELALDRGDTATASQARALRTQGLETLNTRLWRDREGHHAFGILESGSTNDNLTVWPATAATFSLLDSAKADRTLTKLAADSVTADWGARILSTGSPLYDPMHYNNGAVWPFVTGFVIWGQYNYRRPWSAYPLVSALSQVTFDWARGRHPELLSGRYYRPLDTAVPQQFFASSMLLSPVLYGLFGFDPDAAAGRVRLAPQLPPQWDTTAIHALRVGETVLDIEIAQERQEQRVTIRRRGPPVTLDLTLTAPPGATGVRLTSEPGATVGEVRPGSRETRWTYRAELADVETTLALSWSGGLAVEPPTMDLVPGQESRGLRILDFRFDEGAYRLEVEGDAGAPYEVAVRGAPVTRVDGAEVAMSEGDVTAGAGRRRTALTIPLPAGAGRVTRTIRLWTSP